MLLTKDGYIQGYNAQAAVDAEAQIIVAHGLTQSMSDQDQLVALVDGIKKNLGRKPREASADAGYCSEANLGALAARGIGAYIATGRRTTHRAERKRGGALTQAMRDKLKPAGSAKPLQAQKANSRAGVRTAQTGTRVQTVPVTRHRQSEGRMGADLHRTQPRQARPGQLSRLSFIPPLTPTAIWTGS